MCIRDRMHPDQMRDLSQHAAQLRRVLEHDGAIVAAQPERVERRLRLRRLADAALHLRDVHLHDALPFVAPTVSTTGLAARPNILLIEMLRRLATFWALSSWLIACIVALTTLCALFVPSALVKMSPMPC